MTAAERLLDAGWRRVVRMTVLPDETADQRHWRAPDGKVLEESAALAELKKRKEDS